MKYSVEYINSRIAKTFLEHSEVTKYNIKTFSSLYQKKNYKILIARMQESSKIKVFNALFLRTFNMLCNFNRVIKFIL